MDLLRRHRRRLAQLQGYIAQAEREILAQSQNIGILREKHAVTKEAEESLSLMLSALELLLK